jgi:hypothetical protein
MIAENPGHITEWVSRPTLVASASPTSADGVDTSLLSRAG